MSHRALMACIIIFLLAAAAAVLTAGPLNPPAGPVTGTYKTLGEVEPRIVIDSTNTPGDATSLFKITLPGSYYLTGNITGGSGKNGIVIASHDVSLDLNGFTVQGVAGALAGITRDTTPRGGITLRNGVVSDWPSSGVNLQYIESTFARGLVMDGVIARANGLHGFMVGDNATVTRCIAGQNAGMGFNMGNHARLENCVATGNQQEGFGNGFGCAFSGCLARANTIAGFRTSGNASFVNCTGTLNTGDGFNGPRSQFSSCDASFNSGSGFITFNGLVESCSATSNSVNGIQVSNSTTVRGCSAVANNSVGILATGFDNRIDGNNAVSNPTGVSITGTGNLVIGNSASGGTTRFNIVAGNSAGPIITAAGMAGLTNPGANFDF